MYLERYKGKRVMIQLRQDCALFAVTANCSGDHPKLQPAVARMAADQPPQVIGPLNIIPECEIVEEIEDDQDGIIDRLIVRTNDGSGAEIDFDIRLECIVAVAIVSKAPEAKSKLIL